MKKLLTLLIFTFSASVQAELFPILNADNEISKAEQICIDAGWNNDSCKRARRDDLINELLNQIEQRRMDLYTAMTSARLETLEMNYLARDARADEGLHALTNKIGECRQWYKEGVFDFNDYGCILNSQKAVISFQVATYNDLLVLIHTELQQAQ